MKLSLVVPLVLVACSTYSKPGASPAELDKAETECEVKMGQARVRGVYQRSQFMDRCMSGEGWAAK